MDLLLPSRKSFPWLFAAVLIAVIAWVYWPVNHAGFIWIDKSDFVEHGWLRTGDLWKHYILRDFNGWTQYFRPLVVALFTLQVRLFHDTPGPMHTVTLVMHLGNVLLVGLLTRRCCGAQARTAAWLSLAAMVIYGLHPMLIEPVAWIGCQFEQVVNLLTLGALLASLGIGRVWLRAGTVTVLFFLAACAKESAVAIPPLVVLFDWLLYSDRAHQPLVPAVRQVLRRNLPTYAGMVLAGVVYLFLRHWALGALINTGDVVHHQSGWAHFQQVCFLYVHYWTSLFSPSHMSIIHPVDVARFQSFSISNVATDVLAVAILGVGTWLAVHRASVLGVLVLAVTVSLVPVLHIVALNFDASLYHERYAMMALAMACVLVMRMRPPKAFADVLPMRRAGSLSALLLAGWALLAIMNIRATLPFWANDIALWQWAAKEYPRSALAANNLLSSYVNHGNYSQAHDLLKKIKQEKLHCPRCTLNEAFLALAENKPDVAEHALQIVRDDPLVAQDPSFYRSYLTTTGQMLVAKGEYHDAEGVLREAVRLSPTVASPRILLTLALAGQGRLAQARAMEQAALAALPLAKRPDKKRMMDAAIAKGAEASRGNPVSPAAAPARN